MTFAKQALRAATYALGGLVLTAGGIALYLYWAGASVGLGGSGRRLVVEFVDTESRFRQIEEDRALEAVAGAHPARESLGSRVETMARPAGQPGDAPAGSENYWTDYRGPRRDGIYDQKPLNLVWPSDGPPELWRQQIGGGYASMVVADSLFYTIDQRHNLYGSAAYSHEY